MATRFGDILWLGAALAVMAPAEAWAADAEVDGVVVTAPRLEDSLPQQLARYGSDLEIITSETVRNSVYVDVSQALQMQTPGLYLAPRNGPFSYADISLQGSRTGDVLWLVDGVRINNRLYTSTSPADTLPASMVERIEVLKGGQSLFYGTQAAAGVINIVTRSYAEDFGGALTVGGNSRQGVHADLYVRDTLGPHRVVAWVSKDEAEGFRAFDVFQPSATARKRGYNVVSLGGKYGVDVAPDVKLNLYYQHTDAHLDYPGPRLTRLSFNDRDEEIASASLDWQVSARAAVSIKGYFHDWDSEYSTVNNVPGQPGAPGVIVDDLTYWGYQDYGVSALASFNLHRGFQYEVGYDFQNFKGRDEVLLIAERTEKVQALVAQVRTDDTLFATARFAAGVRYNTTGRSQTTIWNVSGHWDVTPGVYLEGMAGTSFLLPSAEQLFAFDPCCASGDPNLKPEQALNGNVAIGGSMADGRLTWQVSGFSRRVKDLIVDVYDRPAFPDGIYVNTADRVKVRGLEVTGTARLAEGLTVRGSYTYTRARESGAGQQFSRIPQAQAKAGVAWDPTDHPFGGSVSALWTGEVFSTVSGFGRLNYGDYVVADVAAYVFVDGDKQRHKVTARLENAFDEAYAARINSAVIDLSTQRFLYAFRGAPRTLHVSYAYSF